MSASARQLPGTDESRRKIIIVVAIVSGIAIAAIFYILLRASGGGRVEPTLENAIRPSNSEFEQYRERIVLDPPEADEAKRALGDIVMSVHTTARNFTGRTLDGLEVRAAVVNHQGQPVKERTVVVIPTRQPELHPNKTMYVQVMLEGMTDNDDRANIRMEITGFTFKQ